MSPSQAGFGQRPASVYEKTKNGSRRLERTTGVRPRYELQSRQTDPPSFGYAEMRSVCVCVCDIPFPWPLSPQSAVCRIVESVRSIGWAARGDVWLRPQCLRFVYALA